MPATHGRIQNSGFDVWKHPTSNVQRPTLKLAALLFTFCLSLPLHAQTNLVSTTSPAFDAGASLIRVFGALGIVLAVFLGGVWLFRNWQRLIAQKRGGTQLNVVEIRSLGNKQSLVVIGYGQQRMLLGTSPSGVNLITHLPADDDVAKTETPAASSPPSFLAALQQVLTKKTS